MEDGKSLKSQNSQNLEMILWATPSTWCLPMYLSLDAHGHEVVVYMEGPDEGVSVGEP